MTIDAQRMDKIAYILDQWMQLPEADQDKYLEQLRAGWER